MPITRSLQFVCKTMPGPFQNHRPPHPLRHVINKNQPIVWSLQILSQSTDFLTNLSPHSLSINSHQTRLKLQRSQFPQFPEIVFCFIMAAASVSTVGAVNRLPVRCFSRPFSFLGSIHILPWLLSIMLLNYPGIFLF